MIISAASDYRAAAQRILPPFLFHYMDGGAYSEYTLRRNVEDLSEVALRQRILKNMSDLSLETTLFNEKLSMPVALAPVGLCGMYARRGEVQAAVGLNGRPHDLGNISAYLGKPTGLEDYIGWLGNNFDPSISWKDLEWIRDFWDGPMVIKGILDPEDARDAVRFGADGIVVSNHGGRQLDGVLSSARALPAIADAVKGDIAILADSGIRNGLDVVRMIALGADTVLLGRAFLYALATAGQAGVANLLNLIEKEMKVAMTLTGAKSISEITQDSLVQGLGKELPAALAPMAKGNAA